MSDPEGASDPFAARARKVATELMTPEGGLPGQGVRFALTGATVAVVYLGVTTVLAAVLGLPFQAALAIGFATALVVHFTLQRAFVWIHHTEFALSLLHQAGRYLISAAVQYGVTVASTTLLPPVLGLPTEIVYLATVATLMGANFFVFRYGIFHARSTTTATTWGPGADAQ
jgi:putative flippase GtrA